MGLGVLGEDVEDQAAAVEDLDPEQALERLLLVGRQLVVGDEQREAGLRLGVEQLLRLALAEVPVGVDVAAVLPLGADHLGAGRVGQAASSASDSSAVQPAIVAGVDGDQEGALQRRGEVDERRAMARVTA